MLGYRNWTCYPARSGNWIITDSKREARTIVTVQGEKIFDNNKIPESVIGYFIRQIRRRK